MLIPLVMKIFIGDGNPISFVGFTYNFPFCENSTCFWQSQIETAQFLIALVSLLFRFWAFVLPHECRSNASLLLAVLDLKKKAFKNSFEQPIILLSFQYDYMWNN